MIAVDAKEEVYPRVCGGTLSRHLSDRPSSGLSPRVRGNPLLYSDGIVMVGSIPACAGEPSESPAWAGWQRVYPRVCGGTPWR